VKRNRKTNRERKSSRIGVRASRTPQTDGTLASIFQRLIKSLDDGVVTFDKRGRVTSWNRGAARIYGYHPSDVVGKTLQTVLPKALLKEWRGWFESVVLRGHVIREAESVYPRSDGSKVWITTSMTPIRGRRGEILGAVSIIKDTTREKTFREELRRSERMYRELFEASKDIIFISDVKGEFIDINQAGVEAFGYKSKEEMLRLNIPRDLFVDPRDRKKLHEQIARNGYTIEYPLRLKKKTGEILDAVETSTPILNERGDVVAFRGILRDVTEKKQLEQKLKESEQKYRTLIEHSPDGAAVTYGGKFLYANQALASLYGYDSVAELLNKAISDLVSGEQRDDVMKWILRHEVERKAGRRFEYTGLRKDNKTIEVEVQVSQIPFEGKQCLLSFHRDITERKLLHEELGEAERIVTDILATMGDALVITDLHGKVLQVNREFEKMTGYSRSDAFGVEFPYPWLLEEEMSRFVLWISELRTKSYLHDFDMNWVTKAKKKIAVSLNTTLLRNTRGEPIAMLNIARDISERKRLAEELESRTEQIEHLYQETLTKSLEIERRNKELDDFTYVVSHDLKEPLVTIEGYGKILQADFKEQLGATGLDYLNSIITSSTRMKKFIEDLLALTRLSRIAESFRPVDFGVLVREIGRDLEFALREKNIHLTVESSMPTVVCNESQMKLVFRNLISNAIKFNDKPMPEISIGCEENADEYRFFVKDNGIGIEQQYFDKIFGIFQRLHRSEDYGGTGVGLTIVQKIIDLHHGRIWVESKVGEGSTFFFTLPRGGKS
jgi:PAS domain S-box-containing protein